MPRQSRTAGFTLLEIMIALALFAIISGSALQMSLSGSGAYRLGISVADLEMRSGRAVERLVRELSAASADTLDPADPDGGGSLTFQMPVGGPQTVTFRVELAPLEIRNGVDDNGDGLIDEGLLVRIADLGLPSEQRVVLARGVADLLQGETANGVDDNGNGLDDEGGFAITLQTGTARNSITVWLTLQSVGPVGEILERTTTTTVALRN